MLTSKIEIWTRLSKDNVTFVLVTLTDIYAKMEPERYYMLVGERNNVYFVPETDFDGVIFDTRYVSLGVRLKKLLYSYELDEARSSVNTGRTNISLVGIFYISV